MFKWSFALFMVLVFPLGPTMAFAASNEEVITLAKKYDSEGILNAVEAFLGVTTGQSLNDLLVQRNNCGSGLAGDASSGIFSSIQYRTQNMTKKRAEAKATMNHPKLQLLPTHEGLSYYIVQAVEFRQICVKSGDAITKKAWTFYHEAIHIYQSFQKPPVYHFSQKWDALTKPAIYLRLFEEEVEAYTAHIIWLHRLHQKEPLPKVTKEAADFLNAYSSNPSTMRQNVIALIKNSFKIENNILERIEAKRKQTLQLTNAVISRIEALKEINPLPSGLTIRNIERDLGSLHLRRSELEAFPYL